MDRHRRLLFENDPEELSYSRPFVLYPISNLCQFVEFIASS